MRSPVENRALGAVLMERERQDKKWGVQEHDPCTWMTILGEEVGEACQEALREKFGDVKLVRQYEKALYKELSQVAAVAVAAMECLDRDKWWREV